MAKGSMAPTPPVKPGDQIGRASPVASPGARLPVPGAALLQAIRFARQAKAVWLVLGIGAILRLATLGVQSFWLDEAVSFWTVNRSLSSLVDLLSSNIRPLFFWVLYPAYLLGTQEWLLRLPSALAGIASLGMLYVLGRELFDHTTALLATALLALSPLHLWYSQEARFYALVGFLSLGAVYFAVRGLKHNRIYDWLLLGVFEGLGLWTETAAIWYILALNLSAVLMVRYLLQRRRIAGWALAQALGLILYLPSLGNFARTVQGEHATWIPPATIRELLRVISDFSGGFMHSAWFGVLSILAVGLGLALGLRGLWHEAPRRWLGYALLLPWLVVPILTNFVLSQPYYRPEFLHIIFGSRPSIFLTRNLITALFPLLLLLARSLVLLYRRSPPISRWLSLGLAGGLLALYAAGYVSNHMVVRKEDYRSATLWVVENAAPGDLVLTSPGYIEQSTSYYYYEKEPPHDLSLESVRDGVVDDDIDRADPSRQGEVEEDLEELIQQHDRVWLVTNDNIFQQPDPELIHYLEEHGQLEQTARFTGTLVQLYVLPETKASQP